MNHWLVKTEPETHSWDDQLRQGTSPWDGVRNHQAAANLRAMKAGDLAFFYHSGAERRIVGVVRCTREAYPDPSDATGKFVMVDVTTVAPMPKPVTLAAIKADPALADIWLVKHSRLSVMPIDAAAWKRICKMGGMA
ncbi:MAG: EVE domain-containing protein [Alphaproteobacteria bacterium]|nr:EVE domain-containing protein [Alphaproteobacteria bacterium]